MQKGFPTHLLSALVCQKDGEALRVQEASGPGTYIERGALVCARCAARYAIEDGIVDMLGRLEDPMIATEQKARDAQASAYDQRLAARYEKEVPSTLRTLGPVEGHKIIEYGCGTGRFTTKLVSAETVLAIDISRASLRILKEKLESDALVGLVLADATRFTVMPGAFDKALSAQVLEHVPTPEEKKAFLRHVADALVPGGTFVASMYHHDLRRRWRAQPVEGVHGGGIFFRYVSMAEAKELFKERFTVHSVRPIDITLPLERFFIPARARGALSRMLEHIPFVRELGHLVLVQAEKTASLIITNGRFFPRRWYWFEPPRDVRGAAVAMFYSYEAPDPRFTCKRGMTTTIDLRKTEEELWQNMRENFIRKQIQRGERKGITVRQGISFDTFVQLYREFRAAKGLPADNLYPLRDAAMLFGAYLGDTFLAGGLFLGDETHLRAWALASARFSDSGPERDLVGEANRLVIWEAMKHAKREGYKVFDLGGIDAESTKANEVSLREFKEAFGGERRECFFCEIVYSPVIRAIRAFRRLAHKV